MRIAIDSFRGEVPRLTPRALPANAAQDATNARLLSGDLEAWRQFALEQALSNTGSVLTIYNLNGTWLSWNTDVDVARGAVAGDTSYRVFLTGPDEYDRPRWTNATMAVSGAAPYPFATRPLGVPPPDAPPTVTPGVDPNPTSFTIDTLDEGDVLATSWTISTARTGSTYSTVTQVTSPFPAYLLQFDEIHNPGEEPWLNRNFGIASATVARVNAQFELANGATGVKMVCQADSSGAGVVATYAGGAISVGTSSSWGYYSSAAIASAAAAGVTSGVVYDLELVVVSNADGTQTATVTLYAGSAQIATVSGSGEFTKGDYVGFSSASPDDFGSPAQVYVTNILVQASGSTGYNPVSTATTYVYTYVNDIGEESAPSFASGTVLRPDGVSITVTTPTDVPTGINNADWIISTKRIYRAVTGATGTFYRFVAEIALATADYVDSIQDTELGEVLESELWDLPPVDMKGMLALPNSVMAGFSKNQLCLSAQNHPHAWPVEYRLTVDTDIVAIGNIDTTVVIGTKNFIYLAIGTDPSAYSMTKLEVPQACVAKRSLAYLIGIGVVFASPDGLIAVAGNGNVRNLTSGVFTREQWQALVPETIVGVAHDDVYHFFYDNTPTPVATDTEILLDPNNPASLTYGSAYLAAFPSLVGFDNADAGFKSTGASGVISTFSGITGVTVSPAASATAAAKGDTADVATLFTVGEFTIRALPAGVQVAVGVFSPSLGPAGDLDAYLLGYSNLTTYWASNGVAFGYGGSESSVATFAQGDVIGVIVDGTNSTAYFFKNGVDTGFTEPISNTNALYFFASVQPTPA